MFMFEKAITGGRRYWLWILALMALLGLGLLAWLHQYQQGLGVTGLNRDISWGLYIAQFTFLVGVAASAVMVVLPYYLHNFKVFAKITILGEFLAISAVSMFMLFVFVDMGQPTRVLNMMLHPTLNSIMFWDFLSLGGYLLLNGVIALVTLSAERKGVAPPAWIKPVILLSIPWAVSIHTVTAFLYSGLGGRPFWNSAILAPRFIASAFVTGPAFLIVSLRAIAALTPFRVPEGSVRTLASILRVTCLLNLFMIGAEAFTQFYTGGTHGASARYLFFGAHGHTALVPWIWTALALNVSAALILLSSASRAFPRLLELACVLTFVGVWIEKGMGLIIPAFVPSTLHEIVEYAPSLTEWKLTAGIWAFGLALFTVAVKIAIQMLTGRSRLGPARGRA